jgi:hypothetical protein
LNLVEDKALYHETVSRPRDHLRSAD